MPRFSNTQKETRAIRGVSRCMNLSERPLSRTSYQSFPTLGARKRNTVSIVTVTAAVPIYFRIHTHSGTGPARSAISMARAPAEHRRLLWQVKNRSASRSFPGSSFRVFRQWRYSSSGAARKITRFRTISISQHLPSVPHRSGPSILSCTGSFTSPWQYP